MVEDHSDNERKPVAATTCVTLQLASIDLLNAASHRQDSTYTGLCYISCGVLAEREIDHRVTMRDRQPIAP